MHTPAPEDDARLTSQLRLMPGFIGWMRKDTGNVLLELRNGSRTWRSRASRRRSPFRAEQPELAPALLEAARPHALPQHDWVQLVIENDAALAAAIANGGTALKLEMFHMQGAIG